MGIADSMVLAAAQLKMDDFASQTGELYGIYPLVN
jgi:hypothetical protein